MADEKLVALTEQGNLGLGVHEGQNDTERDLLKQKLNEMMEENNQQNKK